MRPFRGVIGWLPLVLLTACVASQTGAPTAGRERPAVDRLLTRGQIQVAEAHLQDFGFDPGPVDGTFTAQTQAAVRAYQARWPPGVGPARSRHASRAETWGGPKAGGLVMAGGVSVASVRTLAVYGMPPQTR
jgi:Putative peptidoglycan binding domain